MRARPHRPAWLEQAPLAAPSGVQGSHCRRFRHSGLTPIRTGQREPCRSEAPATGAAMPATVSLQRPMFSRAAGANSSQSMPSTAPVFDPWGVSSGPRVVQLQAMARTLKDQAERVVDLAQKRGVSLATVGRSSWSNGSRPFAGSIAFDSRHRLERLGARQPRLAADQPFRRTGDDALDRDGRRNRQAHGCGGSPSSKS
jgi:hypothetical protein